MSTRKIKPQDVSYSFIEKSGIRYTLKSGEVTWIQSKSTEKYLDEQRSKTPTERMCMDCKSHVPAWTDRCLNCYGDNFKIIEKNIDI